MKIFRFLNLPLFLSVGVINFSCKSQQPTTQINTESNVSDTTTLVNNEIQTESLTNKGLETIKNENTTPLLVLKSFAMQRDIENILKKSPVFSSHFTGFSLFDIEQNEFVANYNSDKYFTPASNVKILTLYASLKSFGNKLPGMMYRETRDTLFLRPIGDPTFLNQFFSDHPVIDKIRNTRKPISIEWPNSKLSRYGIGWMWDDYSYGFQPELSWMPIYGNVVHFEYGNSKLIATPSLFQELVEITKSKGESNTIQRAINYNFFSAEIQYRNWAFEKDVPFKYSKSLLTKLLRNAVQIPVQIIPERKLKMDTLYSQPIDEVLRRMMQESDNFIAEQLLVMSAWKNGFNDTEEFREFMIEKWLPGLEPVWIDGSGISRYNLIAPNDQVRLLLKLYNEFGWERIQYLFPQGGKSGTIKDWYPNSTDLDKPYIIAKTGTLSNNHTLSGYLKTKSGKLLVFSMMNNNYNRETEEVKQAMQRFLESIRDAY